MNEGVLSSILQRQILLCTTLCERHLMILSRGYNWYYNTFEIICQVLFQTFLKIFDRTVSRMAKADYPRSKEKLVVTCILISQIVSTSVDNRNNNI